MRYRTVDYAVGWFILVATAIALVGLFQVGRVQRWFSPGQTLTIALPEEGSLGLRAGSEVVMLGTRAGTVRSVEIRSIGDMTATIELRSDFARFVTTDADVVIKRTFGIAGAAYLEIRPGEARPIAFTDATRLTARTAADPQQQVTAVLEDVRDTVIPTLKTLRQGVESAAALLAALNDPEGEFRTTLARIEQLTSRVVEGDGLAARIVGDPALAADVSTTLAQLRAVSEDIRPIPGRLETLLETSAGIADDLRGVSAKGPELTDELLGLTSDLRETLDRARPVLDELRQVAESTDESMRLAPRVILQLDRTLWEIEQATAAIRGSWLLGGSGRAEPDVELRPEEVMP
jgi:phospholipid/cholesterol/gamma-HCH transport system substrate-binding protein